MPGQVDSERLDLDPREDTEVRLQWHTDDDAGGEYTAIASTDDDEDSTTVSVGERPDKNDQWAVPTDSEWVLVDPISVDTDDSSIAITARVEEDTRDELADLRTAGDETLESTAMGAFRRVRRDGGPIREILPPNDWSPPFEARPVVPLSYSEDEVMPGWYEVDLEFGLETPRGREPPSIDHDAEVVASNNVTLDARSETAQTIQWQTSPDDAGSYDSQITTTSPDGYESSDSTSLTVASQDDYSIAFPTGSVGLEREDIRPVSRSSSGGVEHVAIDLDLGSARVATLFATGSRVEASTIREVPDGENRAVDPLPDNDLTVEVQSPEDSEIQSGSYVLISWSVTRSDPVRNPYEVSIELAVSETVARSDILEVPSGEVHYIPSGEVEVYEEVYVEGEVVAEGELRKE